MTNFSGGVLVFSISSVVLLVLGILSNIDIVVRAREKINEPIKKIINRKKMKKIEEERNYLVSIIEGEPK